MPGSCLIARGAARSLAIDIVANGGTLEEAAEKTGFCTNYVRQLANEAGARATRQDKKAEYIRQIRILAEDEMDIVQIAEAIGISPSYACTLKNEAGIVVKRKSMVGVIRPKARARWEEIRVLREEGASTKELAEKYGLCEGQIKKICRGIGGRPTSYEERLQSVISTMERMTPSLEYHGGFTDVDHRIEVKCKVCGLVFTCSFVSIRKGHSVRCPACLEREQEVERQKREEEARLRKELEKAERAKEAEKRRKARMAEKALATAKQFEMAICECCGGVYMKKHRNSKYCSIECVNRVNNAVQKDRRVQRIAAKKRDPITLERLFEKEKGICYLCGGVCDRNAFTVREDGTFIAFNEYPSIDHVIPISRGGTHTWDNVRLAHRLCNTLKGTNVAG